MLLPVGNTPRGVSGQQPPAYAWIHRLMGYPWGCRDKRHRHASGAGTGPFDDALPQPNGGEGVTRSDSWCAGMMTPVEFEQAHYALLNREPQPV